MSVSRREGIPFAALQTAYYRATEKTANHNNKLTEAEDKLLLLIAQGFALNNFPLRSKTRYDSPAEESR